MSNYKKENNIILFKLKKKFSLQKMLKKPYHKQVMKNNNLLKFF